MAIAQRSNPRHIRVMLGESLTPVGELVYESRNGREHSVFRYLPEWLGRRNAFALSPHMPLGDNRFHYSLQQGDLLAPVFLDASPDSWGRSVIEAHLQRKASQIEILLWANDATRMGALRFVDEDDEICSTEGFRVPKTNRLEDLRHLNSLFELHPHLRTRLVRDLHGTGNSLGGARPKSAVIDGDRLVIAKYTTERDEMPIERMEVATLQLAKEVGIRVAECRLADANVKLPVALIARFDRDGDRRVPYISGRTMLDLQGDKGSRQVFYTDLAEQMAGHCGSDGNELNAELEELVRRIAFTILVSNNDDHMQNHGFLMSSPGRWKLSPMFDVNPQPRRRRELKTGISELSGLKPSIEALVEVAPLFNTTEEQVQTMVRMMAQHIRKRWQTHCKRNGMSHMEIKDYEPAFEHEEMNLACRM